MKNRQRNVRQINSKRLVVGLLLVAALVAALPFFVWYLRPVYKSYTLTCDDAPEWLAGEIALSSVISDVEAGPVAWADADSYLVYEFSFYNAETDQMITDQRKAEKLLSLFQYTDEPFVYDAARSANGKCFVYYNGEIPADHKVAVFSGFSGDSLSEEEVRELDSIYVHYDVTSSEIDRRRGFQEQLNGMWRRACIPDKALK